MIDVPSDELHEIWQAWNRRRTSMENHTTGQLAGSLGALLGKLLEELDGMDGLGPDTGLRLARVIDGHRSNLVAVLRPRLRQGFIHFGELVEEALQRNQSALKQTSTFEREATEYARDRSGAAITRINRITRLRTRTLVASAVDDGAGSDRLAQDLRESGLFGRVRSNRIARTETTAAANRGQMAMARENQDIISGKKWSSSADSRTRISHLAAHGQVVDLNSDFSVGGASLTHPGDPSGPASEVINCRCTVTFETSPP